MLKSLCQIVLITSIAQSAFAEGLMMQLSNRAKAVFQGGVEIARQANPPDSHFDQTGVRAAAEQVKALIRQEMEREYAELEAARASDPDFLRGQNPNSNAVKPYYETPAERAEAKIRIRQEASECQSQNIADNLQTQILNRCDPPGIEATCMETYKLIDNKLKGAQENLSLMGNPKIRGSIPVIDMIRQAQNTYGKLLSKGGPIIASLNSCRDKLRSLGSAECLNTYHAVFSEMLALNLKYVCTPETVDRQVDQFVIVMQADQVSATVRNAQDQYVLARQAAVALGKVLESLTTSGEQLLATSARESKERSPSATEDPL